MPQFYVPPENINGDRFFMESGEAHHAFRVLRLKAGATLQIFDGKGGKYLARTERTGHKSVAGTIIERLDPLEPELRVTLCFAPVARSSVEDMLSHAAETGTAAFRPVLTDRTQSDPGKNWSEREKRWRQLLLSACKQCGRAFLPEIFPPQSFAEAVSEKNMPGIIAWEKEKKRTICAAMSEVMKKDSRRLRIFVGPEGGLTDEEAELALESGIVPFTLGKSIMRTETAGIVASALALADGDLLWGTRSSAQMAR
ncbi:MAG: RsmE family RNA methyltransferase [bacterium]